MSNDTPKTPRIGLALFRLDYYAGKEMGIYLHCDERICGNGSTFRVEELLDMLGNDATTLDLERRFKCKHCGRGISGIRLLSLHFKSSEQTD